MYRNVDTTLASNASRRVQANQRRNSNIVKRNE